MGNKFEMGKSTTQQQFSKKEGAEENFFVGAEKKSDGTLDTSRALKVDSESSKELAEAIRKNNLKIPDHIKSGSWGMVWYKLRNTRYLGKERLKNVDKDQINVRKRLEESDRKLGIQMAILTDPWVEPSAKASLREISLQDTSSRDREFFIQLQNKPAIEVHKKVDEFIEHMVSRLELESAQNIVYGDHTENFSVSKKELLDFAQELKTKLLVESSGGDRK